MQLHIVATSIEIQYSNQVIERYFCLNKVATARKFITLITHNETLLLLPYHKCFAAVQVYWKIAATLSFLYIATLQ